MGKWGESQALSRSPSSASMEGEGGRGGGWLRAFSLPSPRDPAKAALPQHRRHHLAALLTFR